MRHVLANRGAKVSIRPKLSSQEKAEQLPADTSATSKKAEANSMTSPLMDSSKNRGEAALTTGWCLK